MPQSRGPRRSRSGQARRIAKHGAPPPSSRSGRPPRPEQEGPRPARATRARTSREGPEAARKEPPAWVRTATGRHEAEGSPSSIRPRSRPVGSGPSAAVAAGPWPGSPRHARSSRNRAMPTTSSATPQKIVGCQIPSRLATSAPPTTRRITPSQDGRPRSRPRRRVGRRPPCVMPAPAGGIISHPSR